MSSSQNLIVTGSIGIDTVHAPWGSAERVAGGSAAYFAAAAALQTPVRVMAAVGGDWPDEHRAALAAINGVDLAGLETRPESQTFAWGGRYLDDVNQRETLFTELGVLEEPGPAVPVEFADSELVFLANTHPAEQLRLVRAFPDRRFAVADTMDLWINIARDELMELAGEIDGIVLNDSEAELWTEIRNPITAAKKLLDTGLTFVVVKKGEHGCVMVHRDGLAVLPAWPADQKSVVDPTGAGDSFAGGFMGHAAAVGDTSFNTLQAGLAWGTVTASFTLETFSFDGLVRVTSADLGARMDDFRRIARVG